MYTIPFQTKMTIIRLKNNKLLLHSPVALTHKRTDIVDALSEVAYIISPNIIHHLFVKDWLDKYPDAKLWGVEGLPEKRADLNFSGVLGDHPESEWKDEVD